MTDLTASGQRIAAMRKERGMTQADLGNAIGRSRPTIAGIEKTGETGIDTMIAIADFFRVEMDWLLCRTVPPPPPPPVPRDTLILVGNGWDTETLAEYYK